MNDEATTRMNSETDISPESERPAWESTAALVSFVLCLLSWELSAAMFIGRRLFGPGWFGPHREWAALTVSLCLSVFYWFWGRKLMRAHYRIGDGSHRRLTAGQAAAVVILMVGAGAFGTWLFCQR